ncbi:MAG: PD40 domain-containing protein [Gemmatimonadetes bacterium]|nr:PD40 domain-containing protein [Gemmatimonadota bacterium]
MRIPVSSLLLPLLALVPLRLHAQAAADDSTSWDVEDPHGPADTIRFETDEGTWMDLDVHPDGRWIVFDLLGDIYRVPLTGGQAELLSGGRSFEHQPRYSPDGQTIVFTSDRSGRDNLWLMDADGSNRRQLTQLDDSFPTNPAWIPDGDYIVAKRHVRNTRSLGGGELWLFHVRGGSGIKLKDKESFTSELNEPYPSRDGRWVYYSHAGPFDYNRDVHDGIFQISRIDRVTGDIEPVTRDAGGAVRPTVSPDGRSLAFIRRVGIKTVLFIRDLASGAERAVFDGLERDQQETWVVHGSYPAFQWTPDGEKIVITFGGKLHAITVADGSVEDIPFTAAVEQIVARALRFQHRIEDDSLRVRMIRWPILSPDGQTLVFQAVGALWEMEYPGGAPRRITDTTVFEFAPSFSSDGRFLTYVTWDDDEGGHLWTVPLRGRRRPRRLTTAADQYANPTFSPDGQWIAFVRGSGTANRGANLASELYLTVNIIPADGGQISQVIRTANRGSNRRMPRVWWSADGQRLLIQETRDSNTVLSSVKRDGTDLRQLATNERAEEMVPSPDGRWIAFKELHDIYVAPLPVAAGPVKLEASEAGVKVVQLSAYGGDWIAWRPDSRSLTWILGPAFYHQTLQAAYDTAAAADTAGPDDWIHANAKVAAEITEIGLRVPRARPRGTLVLRGGRVITMRGDEVIERADIVVQGNRITRVCPNTCTGLPTLARVVPIPGKTVIPGLVDVHAHMGYSSLDITPQRLWEYYANLAYGVTTTHDPSASTQAVFAQSELVAAGRMTGPRIYSTGFILYGAENPNKAVTLSLDDARAHLRRLKAVGAFSVKSYNQMRRDSRQWIIRAAREEEMLVVPEGGSMLQQNLTHIIDGHTGIEHAIPVAPLYNDVLTLFARSRTGYTPTLVVGYGGIWGENYWYQESDVFRNERLLQFVPRAVLDARARRRIVVPEEEFYHFALARTARDVVEAGGTVQLGAHGQLQGLGAHWELWMLAQGGLTPLQALRAATLHGADYIGLREDLGSIEPGKLADLVVLDGNPLDDIRQSEHIAMVMKNGFLYDADMNQVWPEQIPMPALRSHR